MLKITLYKECGENLKLISEKIGQSFFQHNVFILQIKLYKTILILANLLIKCISVTIFHYMILLFLKILR